jgi:hypothetical protein
MFLRYEVALVTQLYYCPHPNLIQTLAGVNAGVKPRVNDAPYIDSDSRAATHIPEIDPFFSSIRVYLNVRTTGRLIGKNN